MYGCCAFRADCASRSAFHNLASHMGLQSIHFILKKGTEGAMVSYSCLAQNYTGITLEN